MILFEPADRRSGSAEGRASPCCLDLVRMSSFCDRAGKSWRGYGAPPPIPGRLQKIVGAIVLE